MSKIEKKVEMGAKTAIIIIFVAIVFVGIDTKIIHQPGHKAPPDCYRHKSRFTMSTGRPEIRRCRALSTIALARKKRWILSELARTCRERHIRTIAIFPQQ